MMFSCYLLLGYCWVTYQGDLVHLAVVRLDVASDTLHLADVRPPASVHLVDVLHLRREPQQLRYHTLGL